MKRALIHIGTHKTASTYIQKMMETNADLFKDSHAILPKSDPTFEALQRLTINVHTPADLSNHITGIYETSVELARSLKADNTLLSSEDLLGPVPTLAGIGGLYPYLAYTLPAIQEGFDDGGVETQFYGYIREFRDWLRSVHAHKFRDRERPFAPRKFIERNALPNNWTDFIQRLQTGLGPTGFVYQSYESDAAAGRMGSALFRHFGITDTTLDQMEWNRTRECFVTSCLNHPPLPVS